MKLWPFGKLKPLPVLHIDTGEGIRSLRPGDFLVLTQSGEGGDENTKIKATVALRYAWDGRVLKKAQL